MEEAPHILADLLSYDEMCLSALIGMSVPTHFINDGSRYNRGNFSGNCEKKGVFVGLVGARFERLEKMEWQHLIVSKQQNTVENGYGRTPIDPLTDRRALMQVTATCS